MAKSKVGQAMAKMHSAVKMHENAAPHEKYYTKMNKEAHEFIAGRAKRGAKLKNIARGRKDSDRFDVVRRVKKFGV